MKEIALLLAGVAVFGVWIATLVRWRFALQGLLVALPFVGMFVLWSDHSPVALLAKDFLFVLPLYLSFFVFHMEDVRRATVPPGVTAAVLAFAALVLLQTLNPEIESIGVAAVGVKVWLLYIPLLYVAAAAINGYEDVVRLLRLVVGIGLVPCGVGLFQWFLILTIGYEPAISLFYGEAAEAATQGFAKFYLGGWFYRIPGTFSFVSGYSNFTLFLIAPAYALMRADPSPAWRRFARFVFFVAIVAAILSGSRGALLFVPIIIGLIYILDGRLTGLMGAIVLVPALSLGALYVGGVDPLEAVSRTEQLTQKYSGELVVGHVVDALERSPFGLGTGMNTGAARYFRGGETIWTVESLYAKAIAELSIFGLVVLLAVFGTIVVGGFRRLRLIRDPHLRSVGAAFLAFVAFTVFHNAKGWSLDTDPINVYFWVFAGMLFKLPYLVPARVRRPHPAAYPARAGGRPLRVQPRRRLR